MILEQGKFYVTRSNTLVGPMITFHRSNETISFQEEYNSDYIMRGISWNSIGKCSNKAYDIIAEAEIGPWEYLPEIISEMSIIYNAARSEGSQVKSFTEDKKGTKILLTRKISRPTIVSSVITGSILYVDHYGNLSFCREGEAYVGYGCVPITISANIIAGKEIDISSLKLSTK